MSGINLLWIEAQETSVLSVAMSRSSVTLGKSLSHLCLPHTHFLAGTFFKQNLSFNTLLCNVPIKSGHNQALTSA